MNVIIAGEESQVVCIAFRNKGHNAYSCDLLPCSGGHPEWHIQQDIFTPEGKWNLSPSFELMIAHPPCTHLSVSGARWFAQKEVEQRKAIWFFMAIINAPYKFICVENPIGIMSTLYRKPDQIIQPWMFGHGETKATCLWLKNLPLLKPTNIVPGREQRIWKMGPSPDRAKLRSKTYLGIANAMAEQWG
jgi:site-specific DNA-cytosine methylase